MSARVLVVDDSPTIRKVVAGILARSGYDAVAASDGLSALDLLTTKDAPFELVLLDFVMPRMTGYEFCRRIRANEALKELPVVLMSAKAEKIRAQFVEQTGAIDAITKPFDARALLAVVEATLQKVEAQRRASREAIAFDAPDTTAEPRSLGEEAPPESEPDAAVFRFAQELAEAVLPVLESHDHIASDPPALTRALARSLSPEKLTSLFSHLDRWSENAGPKEVLRGRADAVPLGEVMQVLQMQQQTGVLVVSSGEAEIRVAFREGLIDAAMSRGTSDEFRLGRYLVEEGLLTRGQLDRVAKTAKERGVLLGDAVVKDGLASEDDLRRALIRQSSELIYEFLRWPKARYAFRRGEEAQSSAKLGLPVASLVMEGFRRVDEWRLIEEMIDFDSVLFRDPGAIDKLGAERLSRAERAILDAIDGQRTVREIVRTTSSSSFDACKTLYQFLQSRLVRRRAA